LPKTFLAPPAHGGKWVLVRGLLNKAGGILWEEQSCTQELVYHLLPPLHICSMAAVSLCQGETGSACRQTLRLCRCKGDAGPLTVAKSP
jgi:hypothetical protein